MCGPGAHILYLGRTNSGCKGVWGGSRQYANIRGSASCFDSLCFCFAFCFYFFYCQTETILLLRPKGPLVRIMAFAESASLGKRMETQEGWCRYICQDVPGWSASCVERHSTLSADVCHKEGRPVAAALDRAFHLWGSGRVRTLSRWRPAEDGPSLIIADVLPLLDMPETSVSSSSLKSEAASLTIPCTRLKLVRGLYLLQACNSTHPKHSFESYGAGHTIYLLHLTSEEGVAHIQPDKQAGVIELCVGVGGMTAALEE